MRRISHSRILNFCSATLQLHGRTPLLFRQGQIQAVLRDLAAFREARQVLPGLHVHLHLEARREAVVLEHDLVLRRRAETQHPPRQTSAQEWSMDCGKSGEHT